jgi:tetratricopeptide (TPR) repeat protein
MSYPYDLGDHHRPITTTSAEAQTWFDRGLIWIYAFDLEMAARCFREAITLDDDCAMAYWGLAYSSGIYYNKPWHRMQQDELALKLQTTYQSSRAALARSGQVTRAEALLIEALQARYQSPTPVGEADYHRWDDDYADAMRQVYDAYPGDDDICALHAEALMTRTPWALWDLRCGEPAAGASTLEAIDVLETAMQRVENAGQAPHAGTCIST